MRADSLVLPKTKRHGRNQAPPPRHASLTAFILSPERAEQLEQALRDAQSLPEGSAPQRAAEERLLHAVSPFIAAAAHEAWEKTHPRTYLSRADLTQQGLVRAQKLWRGFVGGEAGPGKSLYPAYVLPAVRQEFSRALAEAQAVPLTDWGRKLAARARKRATLEGLPIGDALAAEGADAATVLALSSPRERVPEAAAATCADESDLRRRELAEQLRAREALRRLPHRERLAVEGALGFLREDGHPVADSKLAHQLGCTVAQVRAAREAGLAALRAVLGEEPRCPLLSLSAQVYAGPAAPRCVPVSTPSSARNSGRATPSCSAAGLRRDIARIAEPARAGAAPTCRPGRAVFGFLLSVLSLTAGIDGQSTVPRVRHCNLPLRWVGSVRPHGPR